MDAYGDHEQFTAFLTVIEDEVAFPFHTQLLGVEVTVERVDQNKAGGIVAICARGDHRQVIALVDLPLPDPPPKGAQWITAYRRWARRMD